MRRYILRKGDKTSSGGIVIEGQDNCTDHGVPITFIGAQVWCEDCKTVGRIGSKGPHRPAFMFGKQEALDGDICLCNCNPPPVIFASQDHSYHSFEAHELAALFSGMPVRQVPGEATSDDGGDEVIEEGFALLEDGITPVDGYLYDLYNNDILHTHKGGYDLEGLTATLFGQPSLKLVTWVARDSASKDA